MMVGLAMVVADIQQHGVRPDEDYINRVMRLDAYAGRSHEISRLIAGYLTRTPGRIACIDIMEN